MGELDIRYVPQLEDRDMNFPHTSDPDFSVRNKLNGHHHRLFIDNSYNNIGHDSLRGGRKYAFIRSDKWGCHGWWTLIEPQVYFEQHPEWYALINGERTHISPNYPISTLCLSNEEMRAELINNAKLALRWNPHATALSVSQPDDGGPPSRCQCGPCTAVEKEGNPSELITRFVNAVAEELEKNFPDVSISTLAYHYSQKPPKITRPHDNVFVRLNSIKCSFSRPMTDTRNAPFRGDVEGWAKICNRLHIWDYVVNFTYPIPHPNLRVLGDNMRYYVDHSVKGMFCEASPPAEVAELRTWLLAKLMWNPAADVEQLIDTFCGGYYGPAGSHIVDYLDVMHDAVEASDDFLGLSSRPDADFLSFETLSQAWHHLQEAEAAVAGDAVFGPRVQLAQFPTMFVFFYQFDDLRSKAEQAGVRWPMPATQKELHAEIRGLAAAQGINLRSTSSPIPF